VGHRLPEHAGRSRRLPLERDLERQRPLGEAGRIDGDRARHRDRRSQSQRHAHRALRPIEQKPCRRAEERESTSND